MQRINLNIYKWEKLVASEFEGFIFDWLPYSWIFSPHNLIVLASKIEHMSKSAHSNRARKFSIFSSEASGPELEVSTSFEKSCTKTL